MIYTIYCITNKVNGKVYIGFDSKYPNRIGVHRSSSKKYDSKLYRAIRKYGWDNFHHEAIYQSKDRDHTLNTMESFFIEQYNSYHAGYNSTKGGDGCFGLILSEDAKLRISEGNKHKPKQDKEWVEKRVAASLATRKRKKENGGTYSPSEHTRLLISSRTKGVSKPFSEDHRESNKRHISELNSKQSTCPHCGKEGQHTNMMRWHFDRCKLNPKGT